MRRQVRREEEGRSAVQQHLVLSQGQGSGVESIAERRGRCRVPAQNAWRERQRAAGSSTGPGRARGKRGSAGVQQERAARGRRRGPAAVLPGQQGSERRITATNLPPPAPREEPKSGSGPRRQLPRRAGGRRGARRAPYLPSSS